MRGLCGVCCAGLWGMAARATPCRLKMQRQIAGVQANGGGSAVRNGGWQKERLVERAALKSVVEASVREG